MVPGLKVAYVECKPVCAVNILTKTVPANLIAQSDIKEVKFMRNDKRGNPDFEENARRITAQPESSKISSTISAILYQFNLTFSCRHLKIHHCSLLKMLKHQRKKILLSQVVKWQKVTLKKQRMTLPLETNQLL